MVGRMLLHMHAWNNFSSSNRSKLRNTPLALKLKHQKLDEQKLTGKSYSKKRAYGEKKYTDV